MPKSSIKQEQKDNLSELGREVIEVSFIGNVIVTNLVITSSFSKNLDGIFSKCNSFCLFPLLRLKGSGKALKV